MIVYERPFPPLEFARPLVKRRRTVAVVLHHYAHPTATVHDVHRWHLNRGWKGIGYNFVVDRCGTVWEGRGADAEGAHTAGYNSTTIGIAFQGDFEAPHSPSNSGLTKYAQKAGKRILEHLRRQFGHIEILGHSDLANTACPGRFFPLEHFKNLDRQTEEAQAMRRFDTLETIPSWAGPTVRKLISRGIISGTAGNGQRLNLSEDMLRILVFNDRAGLYNLSSTLTAH